VVGRNYLASQVLTLGFPESSSQVGLSYKVFVPYVTGWKETNIIGCSSLRHSTTTNPIWAEALDHRPL
jgi:hypothetical protein